MKNYVLESFDSDGMLLQAVIWANSPDEILDHIRHSEQVLETIPDRLARVKQTTHPDNLLHGQIVYHFFFRNSLISVLSVDDWLEKMHKRVNTIEERQLAE